MEPQKIWEQVRRASQDAAVKHDATLPPNNQRGLDCGFAWVVIRPARGPFVKFCKDNRIGRAHYPSGFCIWYSDLHSVNTQSISTHEAAARAAARELKACGLNAYADSRLD